MARRLPLCAVGLLPQPARGAASRSSVPRRQSWARWLVAPRPRALGWRVLWRAWPLLLDGAGPRGTILIFIWGKVPWRGLEPEPERQPVELGVLRATLDGVVRGMGTIFIFAFFTDSFSSSEINSASDARQSFRLYLGVIHSAETPRNQRRGRSGRSSVCCGVNPDLPITAIKTSERAERGS